LMTNVEGSTAALEAEPTGIGPVLARYVRLVGEVIGRHGGFRAVEQDEGDGVVGVFALPSAAVAAALDAQRALAAERWPGGVDVAVRMAVHTGEAYQPDRAHYEGPAVIRCARIRAAGHGGQVLVSDVSGALVSGRLPPGASLMEVGTVQLEGQSRPERLW
jgi:class 3 adenylate cyclase